MVLLPPPSPVPPARANSGQDGPAAGLGLTSELPTYLPTSVQVRFLGNARRPTSPVYDAASRVHSALSLRVCLVFRCSSGRSLVKGNNAAPCVLRSNRPLDRSCVSGQEVQGVSLPSGWLIARKEA